MRKFAAHFIWCQNRVYPLHYLECDKEGHLIAILPLEEEQAGITFYNGTLIPLLAGEIPPFTLSPDVLQAMAAKVSLNSPVHIYQWDNNSLKRI